MSVSFHPTAGQVALIEPATPGVVDDVPGNRLIGVVAKSGEPLIVLGVTSTDLADGSEVMVSIFTGDGLYRIRATANWIDAGGLAIDPIHVERIQRRRWPRRPVHLEVFVAPPDDEPGVAEGVAGQTLDLSVGGLRVATERPLPVGSDLVVTLTMPDGIRLVARTTVVYAFVKDDAFEYRLAFEDLKDVDASSIEALIEADTGSSGSS